MTLGISQGWGFPKSELPHLSYTYSHQHLGDVLVVMGNHLFVIFVVLDVTRR